MTEGISILIILIIPFVIIFLLIAGIAIIVKKRKQKKKKAILDNLDFEPTFMADIRINTDQAQKQFIKFKGYQSCGLLYIYRDKVYVEGYNHRNIKQTFNLRTSTMQWVGMEFQNGLIDWFKLIDNQTGKCLYINIDTGLFVFQMAGKMTTSQLFNILIQEQQIINQTPPMTK